MGSEMCIRDSVKIEQDIGFEQMALIGCGATTGLGAALNTAKVEPGSTVAVIGAGGEGLNAIQGAKLDGAIRIIAIAALEDKLTLAREFGATDVIDASSGDTEKRVKDLTEGGVDYSVEAIGKKAAKTAVSPLAKKPAQATTPSAPTAKTAFTLRSPSGPRRFFQILPANLA